MILLRAEVLAGKAERGLIERIHRGIDKALNIARRGVARHGDRAERVDRRLDQHVRDIEDHALQARGQADLHHAQEFVLVKGEVLEVHAAHAVLLRQAQHNQRRGDDLRDHRRRCHARNAHIQHQHEQQVARNVYNACQRQEIQRPPRIPDRAQDRCAKVIQHGRRHADEVYAHIQHRLIDHLFGRCHPLEHGPREQHTRRDQHKPADHRGNQRGLHGLLRVVIVVRTAETRHQHVCAHRNADKEVDQQVDQRAGRADRRHRIAADEPADHDDIRCIEYQLQHARADQRDRKQQDPAEQRPAAHVDFVRFPHFVFFPSQ